MTALPLAANCPNPFLLSINNGTTECFGNRCHKQPARTASLSMASLSVQTLLVLLVFVTASYCMIEEASAIEGQREFDYFALSLQWPGTYCRRTRHCCSKNACCRRANAPTEFTIHGLWPDYNDGTWPACCYRSDFNEKEISTLHDALEKYWPSLSCGSISTCHGTKGSFWAHEVVSTADSVCG
ncbi:hypothetical protein SADUNF_Sadunf14G0133700 [Salix dunnii]|uniref:Uncharacterized protein n=1 Tax=Salix dunnii TaxID=1413687 RepID=A0A835JEF7_9ROSI|nr:hypothetical protein SADUNF_Sadunf14G0133700 [Salix dunnii]